MKSNLRITALARVMCLFVAFTMLVSGCGSANNAGASADTSVNSTEPTEDLDNVTVESGSGDIVGTPEIDSEEEGTTEGTAQDEPSTPSESEGNTGSDNEATGEPEQNEIPEAELTEEEKLWQNRVVANTIKNLNVRAEASTEAKIVGKMAKGAYGIVLERGAEWTKIKSGNVEGYISNEYCLYGLEAKSLAQEVAETIATVTTNGLRVRKEPSLEGKTVTKLAKNEKLTVDIDAATAEGWVAVIYNDAVCYVSADYVTIDVMMDTALTNAEIAEEKRLAEEKRKEEEAKKLAAKYEAALNTASDVDLLAALIYCEAGGECYDAQLAVGAVVVNRKEHSAYPNTIRGVIYQKGQFSPARSGKVARILINKKASASCYKAAKAALSGEDNTNGCRSFRLASTGRAGVVYGKIVFFNNK